MKVALTGATGFIGSHVLNELHAHGHDVIALVRNDGAADVVSDRATPSVVDLDDRFAVARLLGDADAAIHTASPVDAAGADMDAAVVDAAIDAFGGTGKSYVHIGGIGIYGTNLSITEESSIDAPLMVSWKPPIERRVLGAGDMRGVVITTSAVYGDAGGKVPKLLLASPRDEAGNLVMLGAGQQHWPTVHVADLAAFFRLALEDTSIRGRFVIGDGVYATVADLTEAAAVAVGAPGAVPGSDEEARRRLGDGFAEVLLLDQGTTASKARRLGWSPSHSSFIDELHNGSYRSAPREEGKP